MIDTKYILLREARMVLCQHCNEVCSSEPCKPSDFEWLEKLNQKVTDAIPLDLIPGHLDDMEGILKKMEESGEAEAKEEA